MNTQTQEALEQPAQEHNSDTLICASKILTSLGYSQSESMEPSADKRRDKIANIIAKFYTYYAHELERLGLLEVKQLDELNDELCDENDALKAENLQLRQITMDWTFTKRLENTSELKGND